MSKNLRALGSSAHAINDRQKEDYYATDPIAIEKLLELETFSHNIWESACGEGHLSKVLLSKGYEILSTDLIDRGYGKGGVDFLKETTQTPCDIITNPPFKHAQQFAEKGLELMQVGGKMALFLRIQFLESDTRKNFFKAFPPKTIYVASSRILCAINGQFEKDGRRMSSAACYAWFIWEKGFKGETTLKWFN
jgi:hypothetical protein